MADGLFGPDSITRKVNREYILMLGGPSALLMQLAHPSVAAGVAHHSDFQSDAVARLKRTVGTMLTIIFGSEADSDDAARRVNAIHSQVNGQGEDGKDYSALDPELLLWVFATLIDSAVRVYEACVAVLSEEEIDRYYEESKLIAARFGVAEMMPPSFVALRAWMKEMIASGEVVVTPLARELAAPILRPVRFVPHRMAEAGAFITAGFLPPEIRAGYGLKIGPSRKALLAIGRRASKTLLPLIPQPLRTFPAARG